MKGGPSGADGTGIRGNRGTGMQGRLFNGFGDGSAGQGKQQQKQCISNGGKEPRRSSSQGDSECAWRDFGKERSGERQAKSEGVSEGFWKAAGFAFQ